MFKIQFFAVIKHFIYFKIDFSALMLTRQFNKRNRDALIPQIELAELKKVKLTQNDFIEKQDPITYNAEQNTKIMEILDKRSLTKLATDEDSHDNHLKNNFNEGQNLSEGTFLELH